MKTLFAVTFLLSWAGLGIGFRETLATVGGPWSALPLAQTWLTDIGIVVGIIGMLGGFLVFFRRESRMQEPEAARTISGGPITVRHEMDHLQRHEHDDFKRAIETRLAELWTNVNGLRQSIGRVEAGMQTQGALREANGERIKELSADVKKLSDSVHEMLGLLRAKSEVRE